MKKIIIAALICFALSSCVTSLHPLVTYDQVITEERLAGKWMNDNQEYNVQQFVNSGFFNEHKKEFEAEIAKKEKNSGTIGDSILFSKSYVIEYIKNGIQYDLLGSLIRLNGQLFINFSPINSKQISDTAKDASLDPGSSLSTNIIAKIQVQNTNALKIEFLDGSFIYDQVVAGRLKIKNERDVLYETFIITASTQELRQFLEKYGMDNRLYSKENTVTLIRKS